VCDGSFANSNVGGYSWYMITYANAHVRYIR